MIGKSCHKHKTTRNKGLTWVLWITLTMINKIFGHSTTSSSQTFTQRKKCQWNNKCEKIFNKAKGIIYTTQFTHVSIQACCRWYRRISRRNQIGDTSPFSWWQHKLVKSTKTPLEYIKVWTRSFPTATGEIFFLLLIRNHELIFTIYIAVYHLRQINNAIFYQAMEFRKSIECNVVL